MSEKNVESIDQQYLFRDENQIINILELEKQELLKKLDALYIRRDKIHAEIKALQLKLISYEVALKDAYKRFSKKPSQKHDSNQMSK